MRTWDPDDAGVLSLPSGRLVRGRSERQAIPEGGLPDLSVVLVRTRPDPYAWETWWLPWPDFSVPVDADVARRTLRSVWERSAEGRVEVVCTGGRGRTGTALACLAALDGVPGEEAVAFVRRHYHRFAVETPAQARFVRDFTAP